MPTDELYMVEVFSKEGRRISFQTVNNPGQQKSTELNAFVIARAGAMYWGEGSTCKVWRGTEVTAPKGFNMYETGGKIDDVD